MIGKNTGLPVLSGEYNRGYTAAIQKLISDYDSICIDMKMRKKRMTEKLTKQWLQCCLENRERLRETNDADIYRGFIRWNVQKESFEYYDPRHRMEYKDEHRKTD